MMCNRKRLLIAIFTFYFSGFFTDINSCLAAPILNFANKSAIKFRKILTVGQVEVLEFDKPVSLAHYGVSEESLNYIEFDKLEPEKNGYRKFIVKAKKPGYGELTFKSGNDLIKLEIFVQNDYKLLEEQLNNLFGLQNATEDEQIRVVPAAHIGNVSSEGNAGAHIYLRGVVETPKKALLAVTFAANAVNDHGVKIFSNPGGQLRFKDLDSETAKAQANTINEKSFIEFYESTNKLIDTDNLYRDLILASENERVISFIQIQEPRRFAVKVRFLEMDSRYTDEFISSISLTSIGSDISGSLGSNNLNSPVISAGSTFGSGKIISQFGKSGIPSLGSEIVGANLASGVAKLFDNTFLNLSINDLLEEGILRVVNEFALVTHSGERISLGKGFRFPVPKINNNVGGSTVSVEYIPIGFKGELKVTDLESGLVDVQLASRLTSAEPATSTIQGLAIPTFKEEFVNSGALINSGQEVILNAFMTETENLAKATSPLGRIIPFLGKSKRKQRAKNLLFVALKIEEVEASSTKKLTQSEFNLPHLNLEKGRNIYADYSSKLRTKHITDTLDIRTYNNFEFGRGNNSCESNLELDPLGLNILENF